MSKLEKELVQFVAEQIQKQEVISRAWVVHAFVASKGQLPDGEYDQEAYREGLYYACHAMSRRALMKVGDVAESDPAAPSFIGKLLGYDLLQTHYSITNDDGDVELVRTDLIPSEKLLERADMYDKGASKLTKHAREIRDFVKRRDDSSKVPAE